MNTLNYYCEWMRNLLIKYVCGTKNVTEMDFGALWNFILVLVTLLLWYVAKKQLGKISKTTQAEFIDNFNKAFFTSQTRDIIMLIDYDALTYQSHAVAYADKDDKEFEYFEIDEKVVSQLKLDTTTSKRLMKKKIYTAFEMDEVLGHFCDIGLFVESKRVDMKDVSNYFGWYIETSWCNEAIRTYAEKHLDHYHHFKSIAGECTSYMSKQDS